MFFYSSKLFILFQEIMDYHMTILHVDLNELHVDLIMLHTDISIYLACTEWNYVTILYVLNCNSKMTVESMR